MNTQTKFVPFGIRTFCATGLFSLFLAAQATATISSFTVDNIFGTIPDGNLNGYQSSQTISGLPISILDVNVTLNLSGGFNGDFYAYLYHNNTISVLLDRPGRSSSSNVGYPDGGFGPDSSSHPFTFDDQATQDVHLYRAFSYTLNAGQLTGAWQPDGRTLSPLSAVSAFDAAPRSDMLNVFNGMDPNGSWTLFVADVSSGGQGTLVSWGLTINSVVPEPSATSFLFCGVAAMLLRKRSTTCSRLY